MEQSLSYVKITPSYDLFDFVANYIIIHSYFLYFCNHTKTEVCPNGNNRLEIS